MEIQDDKIGIFQNYLSTLKKTSLDKGSGQKKYMTESEMPVVDFDKVKKAYVRELKVKPKSMPCSSDALHIGKNGNISFIEFKNGKINYMQRYNIHQKIYDSLLIFGDMTGKGLSFCREHADFILVYNEMKNREEEKEEEEKGETGEGEARKGKSIGGEQRQIQESDSRVAIGKYFSLKGKKNFVRFDLEKFENFYFKNVFTFTEKEFEDEFVGGITI
ncbi:MAG: hypothetical protein HFI03_03010 [Lachnospiraceae bacterium]|jgi:hypothetical protein|nr:hypothetical protein [Lachnospiraceae bacterium]